MAERIGKLDSASRQIIEAIRLFFGQRDPVAVHTLAAAAHQVLVDLAHRNGKVKSILKGAAGSELAMNKEYLKAINFPFNYLKHADRDPEATVNIEPLYRMAQDLMFDCCLLLQQLAGQIPIEVKIYWAWYVGQYRNEFRDLQPDGAVGSLQAMKLEGMPFQEISKLLEFANILYTVKENS